VDDGERLASIGDGTQDFVIANHFLEHCQNPIGALVSMFRVLRAGGILFLAVPDKRYTFDVDRPITPLEHLLRDHREGPAWSYRQHCEEWVSLVERLRAPREIETRLAELAERNHPIHFHVWTQTEMLELFVALRRLVALDVELIASRDGEVVAVVRKVTG
jgi:SAM-dependent methyltransferase